MILYTDIGNFITWFIQETYTILNSIMSKLGQITWANGTISLSGFIITITIINVFMGLILNSGSLIGNKLNQQEKTGREKNERRERERKRK